MEQNKYELKTKGLQIPFASTTGDAALGIASLSLHKFFILKK